MRAYTPVREMTAAERRAQRDRVARAELTERTVKVRKGHARTFTRGLLSAMGDHRA